MANLDYFSDEDVVSFTLLDAHTVERLQRDGDIKLPRKKVDIPKDERWNTKLMSSKLLQGILAGDAIPTIAQSLLQVVGNNAASAVRNARTMVTGAENAGRQDSYENLAEQGVIQKKVWIATADDRTRESHLLLDGEEVDINEKFSNGLMYPADPSGDPSEVYNCRCSMRDHIVGFRRADGTISYVGAERDTTSHAGKIEDEIAQRGLEKVAEVESSTVVEYVNEFETKGYVGLSEEESDAFMEKYHNEELLKNNQRDNERKGEESGHVVGSLFNRHVAEGNLDDRERERMKELDAAISANSLPQDMTLYRGVSYYTIPDLDVTGKSLEEIKDELNGMAGTVIGDGRYVQTSASSLKNFFTESDISMQIIAEEGTPAYISNYLAESEIVLGRDSKFEILGADIVEFKDSYGLDQERITLVVKLFNPAESVEAPAEPVERPRVETQIKGVYKSRSNDTRGEWLQDTLGYSEEEADATLDAIRAYTMEGDVYSKIHNSDPAYASEIETLNNLIENPNMPVYDGEIYRGLHILDADGISAHDQIQLICESGTWTEGGITSFSSNMAKAKQFATGGATGHADEGLNVLIRIRNNLSGVPIQHLTGQRPEGEVLISSNVAQNGFNIVSYKFYEKDKEIPWSGKVIHSRWCEIVVEE